MCRCAGSKGTSIEEMVESYFGRPYGDYSISGTVASTDWDATASPQALSRGQGRTLVVFSNVLPALTFRTRHPSRGYTDPMRSRAVSIVTPSHFWAT